MRNERVEEILPEGYKMTELGPLPEAWRVVRLGEIARVKYGKAKPTNEHGNIPVIGSGGIYGWTTEAVVDFPTLIIGRKGAAGQVWLSESPSWPSDTTFYLVMEVLYNSRCAIYLWVVSAQSTIG
jgi:type I restriction enzyme S subunit